MSFTGELLEFQREAVDRMVERGRMLLALTQGAGKTVSTIATVEQLADAEPGLSCIVLASSALRYQWAQEIAKFTGGTQDDKGRWTGGSSCTVVDGSPQKRRDVYRRIQVERPRWVVMGYEQVVNDFALVRRLPLDVLVCDEISALKSPATQRTKAVKELSPRYVYGLSGTPMENGKPDELFSIMECIDPSVLGPAPIFDKTFVIRAGNGWITGYRNLPLLHRQLSEAVVRVRRDDPEMAARMPRREEPVTTLVQLDSPTAKAYNIVADDLIAQLSTMFGERRIDVVNLYTGSGDHGDSMQGQIAARITALRMLCSDPDVLLESADRYLRGVGGSAYAAELLDLPAFDRLPRTGPKLRAAIRRIDDILDADDTNKVVVFAFFKTTLRKLAEAYDGEAVQFHGGMTARAKAESRRRFQHDKDVRLFLSSDAGGYGVDLPQANWLINLDLPFAKGKADQRNSRHDRVSSRHERIHTETFLIKGSIEEFYAAKLATKGGIARAVIDGQGYDRRGRLEISANSLLSYLQSEPV